MPLYGFKDRNDAVDLKAFITKHRLDAPPELFVPPERPVGVEKIVVVKNTAGATCPKGGLLRIISEAPDPNDSRIFVVTCGKPNATFQLEYLVALWEDIPDGKTGFASELIHVNWVRRAGAASTHRRWGATNDEWGLTAGYPGFVGMGTDTKTEASITYIRVKQQVVPVAIGKANGIITAGSTTGTVDIMVGPNYTSGNGQSVSNCYNPAFEIADEALVSVAWPHGYPIVAALTCP